MPELQATQLINNFLSDPDIRQFQQPLQPPVGKEEWVYIPSGNMWEHAEWVDSSKLENILEGVLSKAPVNSIDLEGKSTKEQVKMVLFCEGRYVAVLDQSRRFVRLIDRIELAEKAARSMMLS